MVTERRRQGIDLQAKPDDYIDVTGRRVPNGEEPKVRWICPFDGCRHEEWSIPSLRPDPCPKHPWATMKMAD
jgi:hypothetical protein